VIAELDHRLLLLVYGGNHGSWAPLMIALTVLGGGWSAAVLLPMIWHARTRAVAVPLAAAVVSTAVLVVVLKLVFGRLRPWVAMGLPPPFGMASDPPDPSFPSGHAAGSFCVAAFLLVALPAAWPAGGARARALGVAGLFLAALVALSRVYLGAHFPSDVLAGSLLGALIGAIAGGLYASRVRAGAVVDPRPVETPPNSG
jgi:membrane-associated phospholipid phosphatase